MKIARCVPVVQWIARWISNPKVAAKRTPFRKNKIRNTPAGLDCPTVSSEEFVAVDDDKVYTQPQLWQTKTFWSLFKAQEISLIADSEDENKINNAATVPTSSEIRNVLKSTFRYLDAHSNGEINSKMDDINQFDDKKDNAKKNIRLFS
ncbi:hypothetical protein TNCV_2153461 [Trichonephila clavipes]|nr:hypothetical protein TNCV_2153461 [Trichonephila clavipes]